MTTTDQLAAIEARAQAATEGPWDYEPFDGAFGVYSLEMQDNGDLSAVIGYYASEGEGGSKADADFIAHARTDVPALLAMVREQQARLDAATAILDEWASYKAFPDAEESQRWYSLGKRHAADAIRAALTATEGAK